MKKKRCLWVENQPELYQDYHDNEWGVPSHDDSYLFEMLVLESFQAGLSFWIILNKRENFRKAFDDFNYKKIMNYDDTKVEQLKVDAGIVRSEAKIRATIKNAEVFMQIQEEFGSFANYLWSFTNNEVINIAYDEMPAKTELSDRLSKDLKKRGMKFVGSVTMYAYLQAVGVVNDHLDTCDWK